MEMGHFLLLKSDFWSIDCYSLYCKYTYFDQTCTNVLQLQNYAKLINVTKSIRLTKHLW